MSNSDQDDGYIVKLRGLPWSATVEDVLKFFKECKVLDGKNGVHMTTSREGRPSGEAFVELEDEEDLMLAVRKDREHMGSRYIEVFKVSRAEMYWVVKRSGPSYGTSEDGCVRLRGLPFGCSKEEIAQFFTGLEIVPNGITLLTDYSGRSSGEAYVQFVSKEVAEKALLKHRDKIGHRYIEIFRSSLSEINSVLVYSNRRGSTGGYNSRPSPYERFNTNNRFQSRGSRNFKGANFSNTTVFNHYDRNYWINSNGNGDTRNGRNRSPYLMDSWNDHDRSPSKHCVHMRGLPFKATINDISDFFKPIIPTNVHLLQDHTGRASGEADVEFASHDDAMRAMSKDKGHMQHRYIELFLNSSGNNIGIGNSDGDGCNIMGNNGPNYLVGMPRKKEKFY